MRAPRPRPHPVPPPRLGVPPRVGRLGPRRRPARRARGRSACLRRPGRPLRRPDVPAVGENLLVPPQRPPRPPRPPRDADHVHAGPGEGTGGVHPFVVGGTRLKTRVVDHVLRTTRPTPGPGDLQCPSPTSRGLPSERVLDCGQGYWVCETYGRPHGPTTGVEGEFPGTAG